MKKIWIYIVIGVMALIIIGVLIPNNNSQQETGFEEIDEVQFNQIAIQSLHNNGFCYEGMEEELGYGCGEANYPFIRIYGTEDFTEQGKILLVTQVTEDLYEEIPNLYDVTITYVFRNQNQETIDTIYVEENTWDR